MCLEYHIFYKPGPTFILIGVPLRALPRGADEGDNLKLAMGSKEFLISFSRSTIHTAEEELEEHPRQQVMATTLAEELSPPSLQNVVDYFNSADDEAEFQDLEEEAKPESSPVELKQLPPGSKYVFLNDDRTLR